MSATGEEALRIAARGFGLFNEGRLDEFIETMHPEGVLVTDPGWPGGGRYEGRDAFKRFMGQFLEAFAEVRFEQDREPEVIGRHALFRGAWFGTGAASRIPGESPHFSAVFSARDGMIDEVRFYLEDEDARGFIAGTKAPE